MRTSRLHTGGPVDRAVWEAVAVEPNGTAGESGSGGVWLRSPWPRRSDRVPRTGASSSLHPAAPIPPRAGPQAALHPTSFPPHPQPDSLAGPSRASSKFLYREQHSTTVRSRGSLPCRCSHSQLPCNPPLLLFTLSLCPCLQALYV